MTELIDLYGFIAVVLRGLTLALEAATVGGIIFLLVPLKPVALNPAGPDVLVRCRSFLQFFALALATVAICSAILSTLVLQASAGGLGWSDAFHTSFFGAGILIAIGGVMIAVFARSTPTAWLLAPAGAIVIGTLLTSHAFARIENRPMLLSFTALHHLGTAAWIGGLPYLIVALGRGSKDFALSVARRFSRLALISVPVLAGAGAVMAWNYVGGVSGMYGTSYGVMLGAKIILLGLLLVLGASNFRLLRRNAATAWLSVLRSVEVEAAIGITAILAAASLTSQPPAADLSEGRVTLAEIAQRFTPRWPRLQTPPFSALSPATPLSLEESKRFGLPLAYTPGDTYHPNTPSDIAWSEYNHHWAGICVLAMGILAFIAQTPRGRWARHWPLAFLGLGLFLLVRADSENWPLGPRGFWESFQVAEVAQHRIFVVLIAAFAIFEWRVAAGRSAQGWHALIFPAICMAGGALLLTHTHPLGNIKEELLAELSHTPIALFAVTAAGSRWLELRLPRKPAFLGFLWPLCFVMIGLMLVCYRES